MHHSKMISGPGRVRNNAKLMLRNVIQHTDTHNRMVEEAEMWNIHSNLKRRNIKYEEDDYSNTINGRKRRKRENSGIGHEYDFDDHNVKHSFLYDDRRLITSSNSTGKLSRSRAHMDSCDNDEVNDNTRETSTRSSSFWMRQLEKVEAADEERWGHAGYKELYPLEFESDRSYSNSKNSSENESDSDPRTPSNTHKGREKESKCNTRRKKHLKREKKKKLKNNVLDGNKKKKAVKKSKNKRNDNDDDCRSKSSYSDKKKSSKNREKSHRKKRRK